MPDLGFFQSQKLSQEQTLSPQIIQALRILQTPSMELGREIADALAKNPLLEEIPDDKEKLHTALPEPPAGTPARAEPPAENVPESGEDAFAKENWRDDFLPAGTQAWSRENAEKRDFLFDSLVQETSLPQLLESQIGLADVPAETAKLLNALVAHLDEKGFLDSLPAEIAAEQNVPESRLNAALELFQTFDPPGIGARDLRDLFKIQLRRLGRENTLAYKIITEAYELFINRKFAEIADKFYVPDAELREAIDEIGRLKRVPAKDFIADENREILPDLTFFFDKKRNAWSVRMNADYIPRLRIATVYKTMLAQGKIPAKDRTYVSEKMRDGRFLINAIEQRQNTIEAIGKSIVARQGEFLENGPAALKPLTMTELADEIGVHETTISRAVSEKYAETPWGIFELRRFFNAAIATHGGEAIANAGVREILKEIVDNEPATAPLSDERLVAALRARGIQIARRTIAKYRAMLNIPPAHMRRKF